jgi:uncharacterized membrane-anchored protein
MDPRPTLETAWSRESQSATAPNREPGTTRVAMIGSIILAIIVGAVIAVVARLIMPGKQNIGMITTVLIGAVGGLMSEV